MRFSPQPASASESCRSIRANYGLSNETVHKDRPARQSTHAEPQARRKGRVSLAERLGCPLRRCGFGKWLACKYKHATLLDDHRPDSGRGQSLVRRVDIGGGPHLRRHDLDLQAPSCGLDLLPLWMRLGIDDVVDQSNPRGAGDKFARKLQLF